MHKVRHLGGRGACSPGKFYLLDPLRLHLEANMGFVTNYYKHWFVHVMMNFGGKLGRFV